VDDRVVLDAHWLREETAAVVCSGIGTLRRHWFDLSTSARNELLTSISRRLKRALRSIEELVGIDASGVHELLTVLAVMAGFVGVLQSADLANDLAEPTLDRLGAAAARLDEAVGWVCRGIEPKHLTADVPACSP
jgi:signal transduction histidine kinase